MWKIAGLHRPFRLLPFVFPGIGAQRGIARRSARVMVTGTDPVSDFLTRVRNGYMAKNATVCVPWSKLKESLSQILAENKYLSGLEIKDKNLVLKLKYAGKAPAITSIQRISRPSLRVYVSHDKLPVVLGGMGMAIVSTPKGLMTNKQARQEKLGGEIICEVY